MIRILLTLLIALAAIPAGAKRYSFTDLPPTPKLIPQGPLPAEDAVFTWSRDSGALASLSTVTGLFQLWGTSNGDLIFALHVGMLERRLAYSADFSLSADAKSFVLWQQNELGDCIGLTRSIFNPAGPLARNAPPDPNQPCLHPSERRLPSPAGYRLVNSADGESIVAPGKAPVRLSGAPARDLVDLDVVPAGTKAVLLATQTAPLPAAVASSVAEVWALDEGVRLSTLRLPGAYASAHWLDAERYVLIGLPGRGATPQPSLIINSATSRIVDRAPFRCMTAAFGSAGAMIAGRASNCIEEEEVTKGLATAGLWVRLPGDPWRPAEVAGLGAPVVAFTAATGDGRLAAILTRRTTAHAHPGVGNQAARVTTQTRAIVIEGDLPGGKARARALSVNWLDDNERAQGIRLTADGTRAVIQTDREIIVIRIADGRQTSVKRVSSSQEQVIAADAASVITASSDKPQANAYDKDGRQRDLASDGLVMSGGFLGGSVSWTATYDGSIYFYEGDRAPALTLRRLGGAGFVAVHRSGLYDSSLGPDSNAFRWWFPDEPLRSLGGQMFMRDYLQPQLLTKWLACTAAGTCNTALPASPLRKWETCTLADTCAAAPPPLMSALNRTMPDVRIAKVRNGLTLDTAVIDVEVRNVDRPDAKGKTRSGMYNLRLFRSGKIVDQWPAAAFDTTAFDIAGWRRANALTPGADGVFRHSFTVRLPTGLGARHADFTAYAFNDDRVKSDTAYAGFDRPLSVPSPPTAYILTIGIDDYSEDRFHLDFAVADANLLAERLAAVPGYRVSGLALRGKGGRHQATGQAIADAIALLSPGEHPAARARLAALGIDARGFAPATPDDLVIVTFAGHGWADPQGNFYLVPADESWAEGQDFPDRTRLISAAQLSDWLRPVDAGDAAMIIDACNSAAVVATTDFKPGPLGDRGLGQLAYDKGILILAASQTDQKAHEDARLGHGFLTAALARDGLDGTGFGRADLNGDGVITLDEWLRYAVNRLPTLSAEVAGAGRGRDFVPLDDDSNEAAVGAAVPQRPSLFDFTSGPSRVVLAREPRRAKQKPE